MPTYDYACSDCGGFDAFRPLAQRNEPCACPACGAAALRVFASAPWLACTSPEQRRAHETNERAQHAPRSSRDGGGNYGRLRHPAGCGCCSPAARRSTTVIAPNGAKAFPTKRPWMISH
jgi:putative FmdB family regulatory protein